MTSSLDGYTETTKTQSHHGSDPEGQHIILSDYTQGTGGSNNERIEEPDDRTEYPGPVPLAIIMTAISMGMFLVSLDRTIISTAIPRITDQFHSSRDIGWYASAYMLTGSAMQLPLGRFYSFYPPKWVYIVLIVIFTIGSAIGAGAGNSNTVIVGRAIQGIGLGGVLSGSTILVSLNAPLRRRPMLFGIVMASMSIGAVIGPLIGGALTSNASWRWCFIINIPIGVIITIIMVFFVKATPGEQQRARDWADRIKHLDPIGAALLLPAVVCLMLALQWAGSTYAWASWRIILLFVFGGVLAIAFIVSQSARPDIATIPPHVAAQRTVLASFFFSTMSGGAMMVVTYWISIWFQVIQNVSAVESGERTIALVLSQAVGAIIGGGASRFIGYPSPIMMLSAIFTSVGSGMLSTMSIDAGSSKWIGYQVLVGLGLGFGMTQASLAVQTVLKKEDIPSAISLIFFGMQFGGSIAVCLGQNIFDERLVKLLTRAAIPGLDPSDVLNSGATELRGLVHDGADLSKLLAAYNGSLNSVFCVAAGVTGVGIIGAVFVQWKSVKGIEPVH